MDTKTMHIAYHYKKIRLLSPKMKYGYKPVKIISGSKTQDSSSKVNENNFTLEKSCGRLKSPGLKSGSKKIYIKPSDNFSIVKEPDIFEIPTQEEPVIQETFTIETAPAKSFKQEPKSNKKADFTIEKPKKKLELFEETKSVTQILQDDINALVNADGFYDEILPEDYDKAPEKKKRFAAKPKLIALLAAMIAASIFIIGYYI